MNVPQTSTIRSSLPFFTLSVSFLLLYYPVVVKLVQDWGVDDNYSHGYFIPFIAAYMVWQKKEELAAAPKKGSLWGLVVVLMGLAQFALAWAGSEYFLQGTSIVVVLFGVVLFLWGPASTKIVWVPIAYLAFMVPLPAILWNKIAFPMKLFASKVAADAIQALGYTVLREGNILTLPNTVLEVADACSGLRSLTSLLALSAAMAYLASMASWKKWLLFLSAAPIAVVCNVLRLIGTAVLARYYGAVVAEGFLHTFSGWAVFILGLAMLAAVYTLLRPSPQTQ
uniref:Exosortase n=1 Tax=Desulfacinum infernum TaxID=35837 RepID=A0A832A8H3_9BACT